MNGGVWRRARHRVGVVAVAAAVVAAVLPPFTDGASALARAGAEAFEPELSEGQEALQRAEATGERVEVSGERTERETVFANPDGETFTMEKSIVPVRVEAPDGGWMAPDATLERRADGTIGPKAAVSTTA